MTAVLVVGGAHIDRRGRFHGPHADGASTPGSFHEEPGGGGFNAARVMAGLNLAVRMITATGGDANAQEVAQAALDAGVALTPVTFLDRATPTYTAILDHQGGVVAALADMELYERFSPRQIARRSFRAALLRPMRCFAMPICRKRRF
jgi:pseudouridine kinase